MKFLAVLLKSMIPSPLTMAIFFLAAAGCGISSVVAINYGMTAPPAAGGFLSGFSLTESLCATPLVLVLLVIAALLERRNPARALAWVIVTAAVALFGLIFAAWFGSIQTPDLGIAITTYFILCVPPGLVTLAVAVFFATRAWPEVNLAVAADRLQRSIEIIGARGELPLTELAQEVGTSTDEAKTEVERALSSGRLTGQLDAEHGRVFSTAALLAKQKELAGVVAAHGQIQLADLATELHVPRDWMRDWIYQLVQRGEFSGYINWDEGLLYSAEAEKLRAAGKCPHCGGTLALAGKGIIHCNNCDSEIFL